MPTLIPIGRVDDPKAADKEEEKDTCQEEAEEGCQLTWSKSGQKPKVLAWRRVDDPEAYLGFWWSKLDDVLLLANSWIVPLANY